MTLTPEVLERVGRYMGVMAVTASRSGDFLRTFRAGESTLMPLRHFAAAVLDRLVADGNVLQLTRMANGEFIIAVRSAAFQEAPTWPEAVLLAAAAVQGEREVAKHE